MLWSLRQQELRGIFLRKRYELLTTIFYMYKIAEAVLTPERPKQFACVKSVVEVLSIKVMVGLNTLSMSFPSKKCICFITL